jgi:ribose/xylose/arabinose/galactoside ABC-type transport system permease subunit
MKTANQFIRKISSNRLAWSVLALAAILLFNLIVYPEFFKITILEGHLYGSLVDIFRNGAPLMILAIGMTLVIATGGVDLSVGPVIAITGAVATSFIGLGYGTTNTPLFLAIAIALGIATLCGVWNGLLVSRIGIQPIVATLILFVAGRGIAQMITNGRIMRIFYEPYFFFGSGYFLFLPVSLFIVVAVYIIVWFFTRRTSFGLLVESIGINSEASRFAGINEKNVKLLAYAICGLCAGIAGILISSNLKSADGNNAGLYYELDAILSVALGGTALSGGRFSFAGSIMGALIIQSLTTTIYSTGVPPQVIMLVKAIVVLLVSLLQSESFRRMIASLLTVRKGARQ